MASLRDQFIDSIERKRKQLDEVLEAYEVFRQKLGALPPDLAREARQALASENEPVEEPATVEKKDLAGKSALECITIILKERNNEPQHFSAIAKEALRRGYVGRLAGSPEEVESRTMNSFWAAMSRADELESVGKGMYRLCEWPLSEEPDDESSRPSEPPKEKSRLEQLKEYLLKHGPTQRKKIMEDTEIPEGTIGTLLKEGPDSQFAKNAAGRWYVREPEVLRTQTLL